MAVAQLIIITTNNKTMAEIGSSKISQQANKKPKWIAKLAIIATGVEAHGNISEKHFAFDGGRETGFIFSSFETLGASSLI